MIDPYNEAKTAGILPAWVHPDGTPLSRDEKLAAIKALPEKYKEWAKANDKIDDPGDPPPPVREPLPEPAPTDGDPAQINYRDVMDKWYDGEYLTEYEPKVQLWMAAKELWSAKGREEANTSEFPVLPEPKEAGCCAVAVPSKEANRVVTLPVAATFRVGKLSVTVTGKVGMFLQLDQLEAEEVASK